MVVLNKKRLIFLDLIIIFSIFMYSLNSKKYNNIINASSTPVASHTIILDAGHGYPDGGATGKDGSIESNLNLNIVLKLQQFLEASNCIILLTRSDENAIYDLDSKTLKQKKIILN